MCFNHTCQIWGNWALFNYETFAHLLGAREVLFYKHTIIRKKLKKNNRERWIWSTRGEETKLFEEKGLETLLAECWWFRVLHLSMSFKCFSIRYFFRLMDSSEIAKYAWKHNCGNVISSSSRPVGTMSYTGAPCARLMKKPELLVRKETV